MAHIGNFSFPLGQHVRRIDSSETGTVVGILLQPVERAIVRWTADTTYEVPDNLNRGDPGSATAHVRPLQRQTRHYPH
jgi:hypothetical protein